MTPSALHPGSTILLAEGETMIYVVLFLAGAAVVAWTLKRRARRSALLDPPRRGGAADVELRESMDKLLVELQETSREINATIDTKTVVLNKLIEDADRRIETLKGLEKSAGSATGIGATRPAARPEPAPRPPSEESRRRAALEREILRLADEGKTELEIARATGVPRGEVELVLSLRRAPDAEGGPTA